MTVGDLMTGINDAVRGTDDDTPDQNSSDWQYWLRVANRKKNELYEDITKQWSTSYQVIELGAVKAAAALSYDLDDEFLAPSDSCYVIKTNGTRADFDIIKPQARDPKKQQVFVASFDPQTLYFTKEILVGSDLVSGKLYLPGYVMPDNMTANSDTVPVPDAYWLMMACAAEIAGSDLSYEDKEPNLTAKANNLYRLMVAKNRAGTYGNPGKSPIRVARIGQRHGRR